jgi:putative holliday junction resolvase
VTRLLGIDLGEKRIGLAVGETEGGIARPLVTIRRAASLDDDADALARIVEQQQIQELVVGLPLEASGAEGTMSAGARSWAAAMATRLQLPVALRDERLTSYLAEQRLGPMKRSRSGGPPGRPQRQAYRERVDREAAAILLQDELDARSETELAAMSEDCGVDGRDMAR